MKKILFISIICSLQLQLSAQNKELLKSIDKSIEQLDKMLQLPDAIIISSGDEKDFDPDDNFAFEEKLQSGSTADVQQFFDSLDISQQLLYPYTAITIDTREFEYLKLIGKESNYLMDHHDESPNFKLKKIYFMDGTSIDAIGNYYDADELEKKYSVKKKEDGYEYYDVNTSKMNDIERTVYESKSSFRKLFVIKSPKPVIKVDVDIDIFTKSQTAYKLDKANNKATTDAGSIVLNEIDGSAIQVDIPYAIKDNVHIQADYKDGKMLRNRSHSCNTGMSQHNKIYYKALKDKLIEARELVMKKEIDSEKELDNWADKNVPKPSNKDQIYSCNYSFSGPVSSVFITIDDSISEKKTLHTQYQYTYFGKPDPDNYLVAEDFKTEKLGVIDLNGQWIIEPAFENGFRKLNNYFYWDQMNDKDELYWFDMKNKKLKKVNYKFKDGELYNGRYMTTQAVTNGPMGIVDALTGEEKLLPQNEYVWWRDGFWEVEKTDGVYGVYDTAMNVILPFEFSRIDKKGNYFFTEKKNAANSYLPIVDIYTLNGKNLTQNRFHDMANEFSNGYIIVEKEERDKEKPNYIINTEYFVMDSTGQIVYTVPPEKYRVRNDEINENMFVVEDIKTNYKGFMNVNGKLIIPCKYNSVITTFPHTAVVEEQGDQMIIDYLGNVIKQLPDHYHMGYFNEKTGLYQITLFNGQQYNEKGERVTSED